MASSPEHPDVTGVHHLGLSVTDLDQSIRFYCDVLGATLIRPRYDGDSEAFSGCMAIVALGLFGLDLFQHADNSSQQFQAAFTGLDHLGLSVDSTEELMAWAGWLDKCGVPRSPVRDVPHVGAMFDFRDPDGIQLEFLFVDPDKRRASGFAT